MDDEDELGEICETCGAEMFELISAPMSDGLRRMRHICPSCGYEWVQALDGSEHWNDDIYYYRAEDY